MRAVLAVVAAVALSGCAVKFERVSASFLKSNEDAASRAADQQAVAEKLLCAHVAPSDVEAFVRSNGSSPEEAKKIVALAAASKACN